MMKKGAGNNCQGMKNQRCIVQIVVVDYLGGFLRTDLNQMGM